MGKYMKKSKASGEVTLMEVAQSSSLGVRTRAKTLALQRLKKTPPSPSPEGASYLQLRSRRLEKPPICVTNESKRQKQQAPKGASFRNPNPNFRTNPNPKLSSANSDSASIGASIGSSSLDPLKRDGEKKKKKSVVDLGDDVEASFGENLLEFEPRERSTRESTPCSFIRDPAESIHTPGSATKPSFSAEANRRTLNIGQRQIPSTNEEVEEFFVDAEEQQLRQFVEKYNYDPVKDEPLPGRYEWVKLD